MNLADPTLSRWRFLGLLLAAPLLLVVWLNPGALLLGFLGAVHALGHTAAAQALGLTHRPQLGFGPRIAVLRLAGRSVDLAVLPGAASRVDLTQAPAATVFAVLAAGPLGALLGGGALILGLFTLGHLGERPPAAVIGTVEPGPAYEAGVRPGDRVVSVDGAAVRHWVDVEQGLLDGGVVALERGLTVTLPPNAGLWPSTQLPVVGVDAEGTWAAAGAQNGDRVQSVGGVSITTYADLVPLLNRAAEVQVRRGAVDVAFSVQAGAAGVEFADRVIGGVLEGGAADLAGLERGDRLVAVDGVPVASWSALSDLVQREEVEVEFERQGQRLQTDLHPKLGGIVDGKPRRVVGIERWPGLFRPPEPGPATTFPEAVVSSFSDLRTVTAATLSKLGPMASGEVTALGGPVAIERSTPSSWFRILGTVFANGLVLLTLYNLLPLPGSDLVSAIDEAVARRFSRRLPLQLYGWICGVGLLALVLFAATMDLLRWL